MAVAAATFTVGVPGGVRGPRAALGAAVDIHSPAEGRGRAGGEVGTDSGAGAGDRERVDRHPRRVARRLHLTDELAALHGPVGCDGGAFGGVVDRGAHPVEAVQSLLHAGGTGRAGHA
ncbi:MAG: hypothetical protein M5U19_06865 [Microthrixaceae bacterium]|nr:hypothetical protein [Microthrixaceae bacterium]